VFVLLAGCVYFSMHSIGDCVFRFKNEMLTGDTFSFLKCIRITMQSMSLNKRRHSRFSWIILLFGLRRTPNLRRVLSLFDVFMLTLNWQQPGGIYNENPRSQNIECPILRALWKIDVYLISTLVNKSIYYYYYYYYLFNVEMYFDIENFFQASPNIDIHVKEWTHFLW